MKTFINFLFSATVSAGLLLQTNLWAQEAHEEATWDTKTIAHKQSNNVIEDLQFRSDIYWVWYEKNLQRVTWDEYECDTDIGNGSSHGDLWYGYWNAKKEDKPEALAHSIKGIGYSTAESIVYDTDNFKKMPRSWNAFKQEIRNVDKDLGTNVYYDVIIQYGRENATNLGYITEETNCGWVTYEDFVPVTVEKKKLMRSVQRNVDVEIKNSTLLNSETENLEISYEGLNNRFKIKASHHEYQLSDNNENKLTLTANSRYALTPKAEGIILTEMKAESDTIKLEITDTLLAEIQNLYPNAVTQISYRVVLDKFGPNNTVAKGSLTLKEESASIDLKKDPVFERKAFRKTRKELEKGSAYYVELEIKRLNAPLFNDRDSDTLKTNTASY